MLANTKKDIAKSVKTLLILLQSMRGENVVITLRNDTIVSGKILRVDADMNIELENASVEPDPFYITEEDPIKSEPVSDNQSYADQQQQQDIKSIEDSEIEDNPTESEQHEYLLVKGTRVRHIDIASHLDLIGGAKRELDRIRGRHKQWSKRDIVRL